MKSKGKRFAALLLGALLSLSVFGCAKQQPAPDEGNSPTPQPPKGEEKVETTLPDLRTSLSSSPYSDKNLYTTVYGLSDASSVGVDEQKNRNEVLYPAPADDTFAADAVFTLKAGEGYAELSRLFASAKEVNASGKAVKIKLPKGTVRLKTDGKGTHAFMLDGFDGLTIEGDETLLLMDNDGNSWQGVFLFDNVKNLHVSGVRVDYAYSPSVSGEIKAIDTSARKATVTVNEEFAQMLEGTTSLAIKSYVEYNRYSGAPMEEGNALISDGAVSQIGKATYDSSARTLTIPFNQTISDEAVGHNAAIGLTMYGNHAFFFTNCDDVKLEDVSVYSSPSMGYVTIDCTDLRFNRTSVRVAENSKRLMTSTADGMHIVGTKGVCHITNSVIENTHDDALNIKHGYYLNVVNVNAFTDTVTFSSASQANGTLVAPSEGDEMEFYDLSLNPLQKLTVKEAQIKAGLVEVVFQSKEAIRAVKGNLAAVVSGSPEFVFKNNIVRNKRNRGLLVQVRGAVIENNAFINVGHGAFNIVSEIFNNFYESMMPSDITVSSNKFINNNYMGKAGDLAVFTLGREGAVAQPGAIHGMTVTNNYFERSGGASVYFSSVSDSKIANNFICNAAKVYGVQYHNTSVLLRNCADIDITDNYNVYENGDEDYAGIVAIGVTDVSSVRLVGNTNLRYAAANVSDSVTEVIRTDKQLTADGDLSDWEGVGADISLVGWSLEDGTEYPPASNDAFRINTAKIAYTQDGIMFAFDVSDDSHNFKTAADFWSGDVIEMFLSTVTGNNMDIAAVKSQGTVFQAGIGPWGVSLYGGRSTSEVYTKYATAWQCAFRRIQDGDSDVGYRAELKIPFTACGELKEKIDGGEKIAVCVSFHDASRPERKMLQVSNCAHNVEINKYNTSQMPLFLFKD